MTSTNKRNFTVADYATLSTISLPIEGDKAWLEDVKAWYTFDGTVWVRIGPLTGQAALTIGNTSENIVFGVALSNADYVVSAQMINLIDASPQFQQVIPTAKFTSGFTVSWNDVLDTSSYILDWWVSSV